MSFYPWFSLWYCLFGFLFKCFACVQLAKTVDESKFSGKWIRRKRSSLARHSPVTFKVVFTTTFWFLKLTPFLDTMFLVWGMCCCCFQVVRRPGHVPQPGHLGPESVGAEDGGAQGGVQGLAHVDEGHLAGTQPRRLQTTREVGQLSLTHSSGLKWHVH